jgi:hypothetical protein
VEHVTPMGIIKEISIQELLAMIPERDGADEVEFVQYHYKLSRYALTNESEQLPYDTPVYLKRTAIRRRQSEILDIAELLGASRPRRTGEPSSLDLGTNPVTQESFEEMVERLAWAAANEMQIAQYLVKLEQEDTYHLWAVVQLDTLERYRWAGGDTAIVVYKPIFTQYRFNEVGLKSISDLLVRKDVAV